MSSAGLYVALNFVSLSSGFEKVCAVFAVTLKLCPSSRTNFLQYSHQIQMDFCIENQIFISLNSSLRNSFSSKCWVISPILTDSFCNSSKGVSPLLSFSVTNFFSLVRSSISFSKSSNSLFSLKENCFFCY